MHFLWWHLASGTSEDKAETSCVVLPSLPIMILPLFVKYLSSTTENCDKSPFHHYSL